jgi:ribosomal protein L39E
MYVYICTYIGGWLHQTTDVEDEKSLEKKLRLAKKKIKQQQDLQDWMREKELRLVDLFYLLLVSLCSALYVTYYDHFFLIDLTLYLCRSGWFILVWR